ncbi:MAG: hypothetical protein H5T86_07430 [Armatimonadetes bacterium]|nr:hypothetical protein [Armatimonadota bacterium]
MNTWHASLWNVRTVRESEIALAVGAEVAVTASLQQGAAFTNGPSSVVHTVAAWAGCG